MATIERPQSFRNKMDEWLYVMRWTTRKSREASPPLFVARAVFSVVRGLFVILCCVAVWWGVDWLMAALESPQQSEQMLIRLALMAGGLLAADAVGRQISYWLGSRAGFHLAMLLEGEFLAKSAELDLAEIEAAGERDLLKNRHALDYTACGVMDSLYHFIFLGVEAVGLVFLCALIGWPVFAAGAALLVVNFIQWLTRPQKDSQDEEFTLKANLDHLLSGQHPAKEIRLFGLVPYFKGMAEEAAERFFSRGIFTIGDGVRNLAFYLPFLAIALGFGYWLVEQITAGEISLGLASMALVVVFIAQQAVSGFSRMTWAWNSRAGRADQHPRRPRRIRHFPTLPRTDRGKTTILISHRFSTVRMADTIYVFQQGRIAERGSHRELMAQDGLYAELFNMQAEGFLLDNPRAAG